MSEILIRATEFATAFIDVIALAVVLVGTVEALFLALRFIISPGTGDERRDIWLRYARWLVAALTFQLAADILETSIAPDWDTVGRLGAIAVIRTFLNYFLEKDVAEIRERRARAAQGVADARHT